MDRQIYWRMVREREEKDEEMYSRMSAEDLRQYSAKLESDWGSDASNTCRDLEQRARGKEEWANKLEGEWGRDAEQTCKSLRGH